MHLCDGPTRTPVEEQGNRPIRGGKSEIDRNGRVFRGGGGFWSTNMHLNYTLEGPGMISDTRGWWCIYDGHEGVELYGGGVQFPAPQQNADYWLALLTCITYRQEVYCLLV
jgi:hypothetical protein